tara:strand:+ start:327 stop:1289 length:963 start_codon:yes stop_codon:yes gene_type:complete
LSIVEKISFLKRCFKTANLTSDKINAEVQCPNTSCKTHGTGKLKLIVKLDTQQYNCWVCGESGAGVERLVRKYSARHSDECKKVFKSKSKTLEVPAEISEDISLPDDFVFLAESMSSYDPDIKSVINYSKKRGLDERKFWYFKIGATKSGRLKKRVILPSFDAEGKLNYYVARSIFDNKFKYINAKVPKKNIIFNEINIDWKKELTLVEGPFDLIKSNDNSTCLLGCSLKEDQLLFKKIVKNSTDICLALDPDVIDKSYKIADLLLSYGINVRILDCSGYNDVGEMEDNIFKERLLEARNFARNDRLLNLISSIKSGSMV